MAIVQINSKDPEFSFIIKKNPDSGMQLRKIRKGMSYGWFSNNNQSYNVYFKDADNEVSFGDQEFEYLDISRFNSPMFVLNAISEYFSSAVNTKPDYDKDGYKKSFYINTVFIKRSVQVQFFEKYFEDFEIGIEEVQGKTFSVDIKTDKSHYELFNFVNLFMMFLALSSDEYIELGDASIEKYLAAIERLDAPFFIRYLFSRNVLRSRKKWKKYKNNLENSKRYDSISMSFGDTSLQRREFIQRIVPFDKPILDVGCGEGFYAIPFSKNISEHSYHAVDVVPELLEQVQKKATKYEISNIKTYLGIDEYIKELSDSKTKDVILTEVIEHMPKELSEKLIKTIIDKVDFDKFIITVPNKDFNQFYMISENEYRHDDHDWEPNKKEFHEFINKVISGFNVEFVDIGDRVDNISTSIGCIVRKKD